MKKALFALLIFMSITSCRSHTCDVHPEYVAIEESRTIIAVIDTGVTFSEKIRPYLCGYHVDLTGKGIEDVDGHGTMVTSILMTYIDPSKQCIFPIKWYHNKETNEENPISSYSMMEAVHVSGAKYVNMSLSSTAPSFYGKIPLMVLLNKGVVFAVAAGNDGNDLSEKCDSYPACYDLKYENFYVVGGLRNNKIYKGHNYGGPVNAYENSVNVMVDGKKWSGTSVSTPIFLGKLIQKREGQ